jgi:16S rRNA (uracil1498-N3)-methyltransferase
MPQILVDPGDIHAGRFIIRGGDAHHLLRVLRGRVGDEVSLFDGAGRRFQGRLTLCVPGEPRVEGDIIDESPPAGRRVRLVLLQGVVKGPKFDYLLEKAVELGADEIVPFISRHSVVRIPSSAAPEKSGRWNKIAAAAAKQCGRPDVPRVGLVRPLTDLSEFFHSGLPLVLWEKEHALSIKAALRKMVQSGKKPGAVVLAAGPEGGFETGEVELLKSWGGVPVSMGPLILRAETAGPAALAMVRYELDL